MHIIQVEVIGDAYVVAGGLLGGEEEDQATAIINMAFDMREETAKVKIPSKDTTLQVRTSSHNMYSFVLLHVDTNWDSHRTSGGCCGRQEDATLLFVW